MFAVGEKMPANRSVSRDDKRQFGRVMVPNDGAPANQSFEYIWQNYISPLGKTLASRSRPEIEVGCVLLTVLIAIGEYFDSHRMSLGLLYGFPIAIMTWFVGIRGMFVLMLLSVPIWFIAITLKGGNPDLFLLCITRLFCFSILGLAVVHLKNLQENLEVLANTRARALIGEVAERERLEREMLEISEREQRRIGQDLHDGLCQHLTGTAMVSHVLARKLTKADESETARRIVDKIEQAIGLARGIAKGLDPVQTQSDGLMQALEEFSSTTSDLFGVRCRFECDLPVLLDAPATAAHIFRIAQEAVCNAIKHGKAKEIDISLEHTEQGLQLCVSDNGRGLPNGASCQNGGMGLRTMAIRAKLIGGQFVVRPNALGGVEVFCSVPENADAG
jgi:signal transduction histidine kinase